MDERLNSPNGNPGHEITKPPLNRLPVSSRPPVGAQTSSSQSHQTGVIKEHWNDLPDNLTPMGSRSISRTGTPLSRNGNGSPVADGQRLDFEYLLSELIESPTSLSAGEVKVIASRIQKNVGSITADQRAELGLVIQAVAINKSESPSWGRERLVAFMMREKGVSGWAIALRKMVESVQVA